jgi:arylsulfatase A-like enzyme
LNIVRLLSSFWWFFRPIFILFFLYLTGDAIFRWNSFSNYGIFPDFLLSTALASVLWFLVAVFFTTLLSLTGKALTSLCKLTGCNITMHQYLLFSVFFVISGVALWIVKRKILHLGISIGITLTAFACALTIAVFTIWLSRFQAENWINIIQKRITFLVWIFGLWLIISVPLVVSYTWGKRTDTIQAEHPSQSYSAAEGKPNIILVTFDELALRNMSVYGYHRQTTPFIQKWAKQASLFTNLKAAATRTVLTTTSLMTGKRAWTHNVYQQHSFNTLKSNIESMPVLLKKNGYRTMAFTTSLYSSEIVKSIGLSGFDFAPPFHEFMSSNSLHGHLDAILAKFFDGNILLYNWVIRGDFITGELLILTNRYRDISVTDRPPEKIFKRFISQIKNNPQEPYFAWIHLLPPHFPYLPPEPYIGMINASPELRGSLDQYNAFLKVYQYIRGSISLEAVQPQIDILIDRYDEFIIYCDKQFEAFIKQLEAINELEKTIVIITANQGTTLSPDVKGHGGSPREILAHIPLIVKEAGQSKQHVINDIVEQIDIPPTVLELAHIQIPSWMEGRSLVPLLQGKKIPGKLAFSVDFRNNPHGQMISQGSVAVYEGDYKLIHDLGKQRSLLFNLQSDPDEQINLIDKKPDVGQRLINLIMNKINEANQAFSKRHPIR